MSARFLPGSPLVGTVTAHDGTFLIANMPVGTAIPLVIVTGPLAPSDHSRHLRRPVHEHAHRPGRGAHAAHPARRRHPAHRGRHRGGADSVECVLRKIGIADTEFTAPDVGGRVNLYLATGVPGAASPLSPKTTTAPSASTLMGASDPTNATLRQYDVLMLPCEGGAYNEPAQSLANLIDFANNGGRVYASHYAWEWMRKNGVFDGVATWTGSSSTLSDGSATVVTNFSEGKTLSLWLNDIGIFHDESSADSISTLRKDFNAVVAPTQSWLTLNQTGNPTMQFVFDTPIGNTTNQCGRVLFNEYHVENPTITSTGKTYPAECPPASTAMTNQEKLLEYSLFALTSDGNAATLTPTSADFGSEPIGFTTPSQAFTWTNNSHLHLGRQPGHRQRRLHRHREQLLLRALRQ